MDIYLLTSILDTYFLFSIIYRQVTTMAIYTRTGDKGRTSLFNGQRVSKSDLRVETYGTIDELNSTIGVVLSSKYQVLSIRKELIKIQNDLFEIGSMLANPTMNHQPSTINYFQKRVQEFENSSDLMTKEMPTLSNFILPVGGKTGSLLHFARTVSRRAERKIVELSGSADIDNNIIMYLNRLSDLLFTMARFANFKEKRKEIIWTKRTI